MPHLKSLTIEQRTFLYSKDHDCVIGMFFPKKIFHDQEKYQGCRLEDQLIENFGYDFSSTFTDALSDYSKNNRLNGGTVFSIPNDNRKIFAGYMPESDISASIYAIVYNVLGYAKDYIEIPLLGTSLEVRDKADDAINIGLNAEQSASIILKAVSDFFKDNNNRFIQTKTGKKSIDVILIVKNEGDLIATKNVFESRSFENIRLGQKCVEGTEVVPAVNFSKLKPQSSIKLPKLKHSF